MRFYFLHLTRTTDTINTITGLTRLQDIKRQNQRFVQQVYNPVNPVNPVYKHFLFFYSGVWFGMSCTDKSCLTSLWKGADAGEKSWGAGGIVSDFTEDSSVIPN